MNKRDFVAAVLATGGFGFIGSRLLQQYRKGEISFSELPFQGPDSNSLTAIAESVKSTTAEETLELVIAETSHLEQGYIHQEREQAAQEAAKTMQQQQTATLSTQPENQTAINQPFKSNIKSNITPNTKPSTFDLHSHYVLTNSNASSEQYLEKIRNFDNEFSDDIYLTESNQLLLGPTLDRIERVQAFVGHGNFNLITFDEMRQFGRNYPEIGAFKDEELAFIDEIFYTDATDYGFLGDKVIQSMTNKISPDDVEKINGGQFLLKGESLGQFQQIRKDVGEYLMLTSGLRNVVKQLHLFLAKTQQSSGNLSKASRSLAPPGYSYHGIGDFDIGKIGLGDANFTSDFSTTDEFRMLMKLGYVDIRYTDTNRFGVRYEPWHIKIG